VAGQFCLILLVLFFPGQNFSFHLFLPPGDQLAGGTLILIALWIAGSGIRSLREAFTPYPYPVEGGPLVREGLYRWIRHPLYLGVLLGLFGVSLWRANSLSLLLSVGSLFFFNAKANHEEEWLLKKFPEYQSYRQKTKKIIPFIF
jgi:protein-S-isoprenylcysteine O-methyltransferase Ste14